MSDEIEKLKQDKKTLMDAHYEALKQRDEARADTEGIRALLAVSLEERAALLAEVAGCAECQEDATRMAEEANAIRAEVGRLRLELRACPAKVAAAAWTERDACARVVETYFDGKPGIEGGDSISEELAAAIRARGGR